MSSPYFFYIPAAKDKEAFIRDYVVRTKSFEDISRDLITSSMVHPEQHYLIVGPRGSGKTTLLYRLSYAIEEEKKLSLCIPVMIVEEPYSISELANLWESIAKVLQDSYDFKNLYDDVVANTGSGHYEEQAFKTVFKRLKEQKKKIILFIDNFSFLLNKFSELEVKRLRELLMTCPELRLIVSSNDLPDQVSDYKKPFFDFFKIVTLDGLNRSETKILFESLARSRNEEEIAQSILKRNPGRIESIRRLSGGIVRIMVHLFDILLNDKEGESASELMVLVDVMTPLYKPYMDVLPKFQQKIVDAVAINWDAISTREIAAVTRIEGKAISAQLSYLERSRLVSKVKTGTKNHLYMLNDRFFNIWYLMRNGGAYERQRVRWLMAFMESWCNRIEPGNLTMKSKGYTITEKSPLNIVKEGAPDLLHNTDYADNELMVKALSLLRKSRIDDSLGLIAPLLSSEVFISHHLDKITEYIILLIAKEQVHTTYKLMVEGDFKLRDILKPLYFALISFMTREYPNEYLKMGNELKETVHEIIGEVLKNREDSR